MIPRLTRRHLLSIRVVGIITQMGTACTTKWIKKSASTIVIGKQKVQDIQATRLGFLLARPKQKQAIEATSRGLQALGLTTKRDGLLYVPPTYQQKQPAPLVVILHGAGGDAPGGLKLLQHLADADGLILLAPASRQQTWDVISGEYGPDIALIDAALEKVFSRYAIDTQRIAVGGFSDGASYALSVGITNGNLFNHVIAFSPGFMAPTRQQGSPRIFISHGTQDTVLPIDSCSRQLVPQLQRAGYNVLYHEFNGSHTVPSPITQEAISWFTAK